MSSFLGKKTPELPAEPPLVRMTRGVAWLPLLSLAFFLGAIISLASTLQPASPKTSSAANTTPTLTKTIILAQVNNTSGTVAANNVNPCDTLVSAPPSNPPDPNRFSPATIFPLVSRSILDPNGCNPSFWNLTIMVIFLYKILGLLNWTAVSLAVIFIVYGGLLYISGFASEANVKKAKGVIITTCVGLIITLSARLILGSTQLIVGEQNSADINSAINQNIGGAH